MVSGVISPFPWIHFSAKFLAMQLAVLSDIHANIEAFRRVLEDIDSRTPGVVEIISLGDTLGYGPEPEACMNLLRKSGIVSVQGNHELAVAQAKYRQWFNSQSRKALHRTCELVSDETVAYISQLPLFLIRHGCLFVHGLPPDSAFKYLYQIADGDVADLFSRFAEAVAFVGHTHELEQISWDGRLAMRHPLEQGHHILNRSKRYIINIGAVGQPRDGDNRAKYVLWDTKTWELTVRFVTYDIKSAMAGFKSAGMPDQYARCLL
jgi:diadenosine tetraphosphatase ApaH/serine/threonine PP2A family protein phosphatase